ncbi:hypothetical protein HDU67_002116, partial [Dinochytrium kinnereticum]
MRADVQTSSRFGRRHGCRLLLILMLAMAVLSVLWSAELLNLVTYSTRPIWDDPGQKWTVVPHYQPVPSESIDVCGLHGWNKTEKKGKTIDAIIFSVELDLLELRLRELYPVVDQFLILESNTTFTGLPKALVFGENQERFAFAADKIRYKAVAGIMPLKGQSPFVVENAMRVDMTLFLMEVGLVSGDIVIMADVDEIPSRDTISMLSSCVFQPPILHLRMLNFIYSFDFLVDMDHWRAKVVRYSEDSEKFFYGHSRGSNHILSESGWHCSFCFPKLQDFVFKMTAYSHADRVTNKKLLDPERIQKVICEGKDIFGMLPEAYTYRDLIWKWGPARKMDSVHNVP